MPASHPQASPPYAGSHYGAAPPPGCQYVRTRGRASARLDYAELLYLKAERTLTYAYLRGGHRRLVNRGFGRTLAELAGADLVRIHKSYAVPRHAIARVGRLRVYLADGDALPLGRAFRGAVRAQLGA